jgi:DNA-binding transcriptional ArsR family regulator
VSTIFSLQANNNWLYLALRLIMRRLSKAERDLKDFEEVFWAVSHASRRHILVVVNSRGGRMLAGEIAKRFSCSWPTTTRHLKVLEKAGLLQVKKEGRENYYELNRLRLEKIDDWLGWFKKGESN